MRSKTDSFTDRFLMTGPVQIFYKDTLRTIKYNNLNEMRRYHGISLLINILWTLQQDEEFENEFFIVRKEPRFERRSPTHPDRRRTTSPREFTASRDLSGRHTRPRHR